MHIFSVSKYVKFDVCKQIWISLLGKPKFLTPVWIFPLEKFKLVLNILIYPMQKSVFWVTVWISPMGKSKLVQKYGFLHWRNPYMHAYMHIFGLSKCVHVCKQKWISPT